MAIDEILELGRWAQSADNVQPWRFEMLGDEELRIHLLEHKSIYNKRGTLTLIAYGILLETLRIAASHFGRDFVWDRDAYRREKNRLAVRFPKSAEIAEDPLFPFLTTRSVNRFPYRLRSLTAEQKESLQGCLEGKLGIRWFESLGERARLAWLLSLGSKIRFSMKEFYPEHKHMLDWKNAFSETGIPARAVGVDLVTRRFMQWAMESWERVDFLNKYLAGSLVPRLEMDLIPGVACSAFYALTWDKPPPEEERELSLIEGGRYLQRFWLKLTQLGLVMQPGMTLWMFPYYIKHGIPFTENERLLPIAETLRRGVEEKLDVDRLFYIARIGWPWRSRIRSRSIRLPLEKLVEENRS